MNQEQLESLPYPMFKTNWYEKRILKKALKDTSSRYLCCRIEFGVRPWFSGGLLKKIRGHAEVHLGVKLHKTTEGALPLSQLDSPELRNIWIRKLLAYSPE
jgi:hypothetical protein